jgi:hypothetical protein
VDTNGLAKLLHKDDDGEWHLLEKTGVIQMKSDPDPAVSEKLERGLHRFLWRSRSRL